MLDVRGDVGEQPGVAMKHIPEHIKFRLSVAGNTGELKAQCTECGGIQSQPSLFDLSFFKLSVSFIWSGGP